MKIRELTSFKFSNESKHSKGLTAFTKAKIVFTAFST